VRDLVSDRLARGMSPSTGALHSGWPLAQRSPPEDANLRSAAVLVPLIDHADGITVLLTQRAADMPKHAGQISFPGGTVVNGEAHPEVTALRETEEEIGIPASAIELIGRLSMRDTSTGFRVVPIVGFLRPPLRIVEDPSEVASVFEVPLDFVRDIRNHGTERRIVRGEEREFRAMPYGDHYIWGLTARILFELSQVLRDE